MSRSIFDLKNCQVIRVRPDEDWPTTDAGRKAFALMSVKVVGSLAHQLDLIQRKYEAWKLWQREPGYDGPSRGSTGSHFCQTIANLKSQLGINTPPT